MNFSHEILPPVMPWAECVSTPSEFAASRLGFQADEKQRLVLDSKAKQGILNCSRQWGKSTVCGIKAVHRAYSEPGSLVLVASPSARQSAEFLHKASEFVRKLGLVPRGDGSNEISLLFPNGSRIVGLPGKEGTIRGFSKAKLLVLDEAAQMEDGLYKSLLPVLAVSDGDLWMMSTPRGKRGFFYEAWVHGGPDWERVMAPAEGCERISAAFMERVGRSMGEAWMRQEFGCEFVSNGLAWFDRDDLSEVVSEKTDPVKVRK